MNIRRSLISLTWRRFTAWLCGSLVVVLLVQGMVTGPVARASEVAGPVSRGVEAYRSGKYPEALQVWSEALQSLPPVAVKERALLAENLARVSQQLGQTLKAVGYWQQALASYQALGDRSEQARILVEQAQGYNQLGHYQRSLQLLCGTDDGGCGAETALGLARSVGSRSVEIAALGSLGETYRLVGQYGLALKQLDAAQAVVEKTGERSYQVPLLVSRGAVAEGLAQVNARRAQIARDLGDTDLVAEPEGKERAERQRARESLEQALRLAQEAQQGQDRSLELGILLRLRSVYSQAGEADSPGVRLRQRAGDMQRQAEELIARLPESQAKVFGMLELVRLLSAEAGPLRCPGSMGAARSLLDRALPIATKLENPRALSLVRGELGHLAECRGDLKLALSLTKQASLAADPDGYAKDLVYLWDWQLGRILKAQGQVDEAIGSYQNAVATLEAIRGDMVGAAAEVQFDFRDQIEPVYRELVALQLQRLEPPKGLGQGLGQGLTKQGRKPGARKEVQGREASVRDALKTVDSLKLAELQNYFGSDCAIAQTTAVIDVKTDQSKTAVVSTILFPERTAVVMSLPGGQTQVSWIEVGQGELRQSVDAFRKELEAHFHDFEPGRAQGMYDWLIRPFEGALVQAGIKTLVFVHDGPFRSVPMAALHDGQGFLVEKYAIAVTPSLRLTAPRPLAQRALSALALGLTEEVRIGGDTFSALSNVERELASVAGQVPGTKRLLNGAFSRGNLEVVLEKEHFPILHIATHGKFGAEPQNNFIVMGDGTKLTIQELDGLIRRVAPRGEPIELLALTACETAIGDERATLGLAGVAIRAGARSAMASLWSIDDGATAEVVRSFYGGLQGGGLNKAEALQGAQVRLIREGAHPAQWAPLILIGNWL